MTSSMLAVPRLREAAASRTSLRPARIWLKSTPREQLGDPHADAADGAEAAAVADEEEDEDDEEDEDE